MAKMVECRFCGEQLRAEKLSKHVEGLYRTSPVAVGRYYTKGDAFCPHHECRSASDIDSWTAANWWACRFRDRPIDQNTRFEIYCPDCAQRWNATAPKALRPARGATGWWSFSTAVDESHVMHSQPMPSWFADLTARMGEGGGEDRLCGEVVSHTDCHGVLAFRVYRRGRLARCEDLSGAVVYIAGNEAIWQRDAVGHLDVTVREDDWFQVPDDFEFGARRPGEDRWDGEDFTRPTGPPREVSFLDRPAWQIELAPPPHKPHPMQLTVDQQTGLILREGNPALGTVTEWVSLDLAAELPDDLFVWHADSDVLAAPPEPLDDA